MTPEAFAAKMGRAAAKLRSSAPLMNKVKDVSVRNAKQRAPVRTGALRDSIGGQVTSSSVNMTATVPYAAPVEYGTSRMQAQPFLHPGIENSAGEIEGLMQDYGDEVLGAVG